MKNNTREGDSSFLPHPSSLLLPNRLRLRLTQVLAAVATTLATVWLCQLGPIPGIIGVLFAKHILVAVLLMGLGMGDVRPGRDGNRPD